FNVGNSREISIEQLARTVIRMTGSASAVRHLPYEQVYEHGFEDMRRRVPDVSKLRAAIGSVPEIPLEHALQSIIHSFRAAGDAAARPIRRRTARDVTARQHTVPLPNPG